MKSRKVSLKLLSRYLARKQVGIVIMARNTQRGSIWRFENFRSFFIEN